MTLPSLDLPAVEVAPLLLGAHLEAGGVRVRLTEVEAYAGEGEDPGSHAHRGRTPRSEIMFGPSGRLYVYFTYGMHWCANVVTGPPGQASAVLLRAAEVVDGLDRARERRTATRTTRATAPPATTLPAGRATPATPATPAGWPTAATRDRDLCRGPARLCRALGLDGKVLGVDLLDPASPVRLLPGTHVDPALVRAGPRVGVAGAGAATPWRYWLAGEPTVSSYRPAMTRNRPRPQAAP